MKFAELQLTRGNEAPPVTTLPRLQAAHVRMSSMAKRTIAVEFESDVTTARSLARAIYWMVSAAEVEDSSATVDGFGMNPSDGWTGDYKISIEKR